MTCPSAESRTPRGCRAPCRARIREIHSWRSSRGTSRGLSLAHAFDEQILERFADRIQGHQSPPGCDDPRQHLFGWCLEREFQLKSSAADRDNASCAGGERLHGFIPEVGDDELPAMDVEREHLAQEAAG